MKLLVTGGCGFIGSNFILRCFEHDNDIKITNIDLMTTGSNKANLGNLKRYNYKFVKGDINNKKLMKKLIKNVDVVVNFAAESHVDRSIANSSNFVKSNINGIHSILETIRHSKNIKLVQISTDEVYGEISNGAAKENYELNPSNPYSATKAAAEMLVRSYVRTYDIDATITRCTNNYGPRQFPEKLIPKTIIFALKNEHIPLHGDGKAKRQWIHVNDHCDALLKIISGSTKSLIYNISSNYENTNLEVVKKILKIMNKSEDLITFVKERPGHDKRYSVNSNLIKKELNWKSKISFDKGIINTINWYIENKNWLQKLALKKIINPTPWIN